MTSRWFPTAVLTVALALAGCDGSSTEPKPSPAVDTPADPAVVTCPDEASLDPIDRPHHDSPASVPPGATSVRLCQGGGEYAAVISPQEALTTRVAAVVRAVNDQPPVDRPPRCGHGRATTYRLAFGYPDNSRFITSGNLSNCSAMVVGSSWREDSLPPLRTFIGRLLHQRATSEPPDLAADPATFSCGQAREYGWTWQLHLATGLSAAVLCFGAPNHPRKARRVTIPSAALAVLLASMRTDSYSVAGYLGCHFIGRKDYWLVGENAWGDPVVVARGCESLALGNGNEWSPDGRAFRVVQRLIREAR